MRQHRAQWRRPLLFAIVLAMALFFGPTVIASAVPGPRQMPPMGAQPLDQLTGDAFDEAFLTQMTMHHAMGVVMTQPVVARGAHQALKDLGTQMVADQTREIEQMRGWLQAWYGQNVACPMVQGLIAPDGSTPGWMLDPPAGPPGAGPMRPGAMQPGAMQPGLGMPMMPGALPGMMPGGAIGTMPGMPMMGMPMMGMPMMGMPMMGMPMMGMPMMGGFGSLPPDQLDATFMAWMIPHHQGAIEMALLADERAAHQEVKDLAASIITSQSVEIETMQGWLAEWYGR